MPLFYYARNPAKFDRSGAFTAFRYKDIDSNKTRDKQGYMFSQTSILSPASLLYL